ncbi:EAL domain-containing protein [Arenibaculum sp.]|jgi:EAL domain-containing protein (putative c-di-GMP-specific phosphodiesterase class I)/PAS domain-containing protein|uniref:EAL domain-containing protein n=1 Tax=Arenibaculum sp. TaxID=2865862 RepID=UPI002E12D051|nr:EAL domain-containing protein [Arenibaculum sp.]
MTSVLRGVAHRFPGPEPAPAAVLRPRAGGCDAVVEAANDGFARLLGRPLDAVLGRRLGDLVPEDDLAGLARAPSRLTLAGTELRAERVASRDCADGFLLLSAEHAAPGGLDGLPVAAFLAEAAADGFRFVEANRHFADGIRPGAPGLTGCAPRDVLPPARAAALGEALAAAVRLGRPTTWRDVVELPFGFRHWETRLVPLPAVSGACARVLGVSLDITGQVEAERALREPGPAQAGAGRASLESRLRRAIERDEIELAYQPKVTVAGLDLAGFEALVRWRDPEHGIVPPGRFIPVAEETGLIEPLGELVIEKACRRFAAWRREGLLDVPVAVNLSARQLADPGLARKILAVLARTGLPAEGLKLELTESALFRNTDGVREPFLLLHAAGVGFMLDDFGTGYSSLSYLKRFPIEAIKIDRSFIHAMVQDPDAASIVQAVVSMAHALKMSVVAEGVETQEQLIFLRAYRCDRLQGYLVAPPLSEAEVEHRLRGPVARLGTGS